MSFNVKIAALIFRYFTGGGVSNELFHKELEMGNVPKINIIFAHNTSYYDMNCLFFTRRFELAKNVI